MTDLLAVLRKHAVQFSQVDDDLLRLYLRAGIEACEKYTGRALTQQGRYQAQTMRARPDRGGIRYSGSVFPIPHNLSPLDAGACSSYCEPGREQAQAEAQAPCAAPDFEQITADWQSWPAGLTLGILKFATWAYANRGDSDSNVWTVASGAHADWQPYKRASGVMIG